MEEVGVTAILQALREHSQHVDEKFMVLSNEISGIKKELTGLKEDMKIQKGEVDRLRREFSDFKQVVNNRFDRLEGKVDVLRFELGDAQETIDWVSSKTLKHDKKLREI